MFRPSSASNQTLKKRRMTMRFPTMALIAAGPFALAACGGGEQVEVAFYGEGAGQGGLRGPNHPGQEIIRGMAGENTMQGQVAAGSHVEIRAAAAPGSRFVSFGGDCSGTSSPLTLDLTVPIRCSVRFDAE